MGAVKIALQEQLSSSSSSAYVGEGSVSLASSGPFPSHSVHPTSPSSFLAFPGPVDGGVVFFLAAASPPSPGRVLAPLCGPLLTGRRFACRRPHAMWRLQSQVRAHPLGARAEQSLARSRREGSLLRAYGGWQTHVPAARGTVGTNIPLTWVPMYTAGKLAGSVRRLSTVTFSLSGLK